MIQFSQLFPDEAIVVTLSQQLSWSHLHALLPIKEPLACDYYAEMCRIERCDVRTLRQKIGGTLFQRTALSKRPRVVISAAIGQLRDGQMSSENTLDGLLDSCGHERVLRLHKALCRHYWDIDPTGTAAYANGSSEYSDGGEPGGQA